MKVLWVSKTNFFYISLKIPLISNGMPLKPLSINPYVEKQICSKSSVDVIPVRNHGHAIKTHSPKMESFYLITSVLQKLEKPGLSIIYG